MVRKYQPSRGLTPARQKVLRCMQGYQSECGFPPTLKEIAQALGTSRVAVYEHVRALVESGHVAEGAAHSARRYTAKPPLDVVGELLARLDEDLTATQLNPATQAAVAALRAALARENGGGA